MVNVNIHTNEILEYDIRLDRNYGVLKLRDNPNHSISDVSIFIDSIEDCNILINKLQTIKRGLSKGLKNN